MRLDDTLPDWVADTDIPRDLGGTLRITATPRRETGVLGTLSITRQASPLASAASAVPTRMKWPVWSTPQWCRPCRDRRDCRCVSLDLKADEAAVHALAAGLGVAPGSLTPRAGSPNAAENPSDVFFRSRMSRRVGRGSTAASVRTGR